MYKRNNDRILSIIISLYNYQYPVQLFAVIKSLLDQNAQIEIIISEQGTVRNSVYRKLANMMNLKYVLSKPDTLDGKEIYNIGRVRNIGVSLCQGKFIYFTDADILVFNRNYLKELMDASEKSGHYDWYRPQMLRLSETSTARYINHFLLEKQINYPNNGICMVDYDEQAFTFNPITEGECREIINDQPHVCKKSEFDLIHNNLDFDYTKIEEFIWKPSFHYGGTLCLLEHFHAVGGYSEHYHNWGMEDEDFHWKLRGIYGLKKIDDVVRSVSIVHFEHNRKYNNGTYKINRETFNNRMAQGVQPTIEMDKNRSGSFMTDYLKLNWTGMQTFLFDELNSLGIKEP